MHSQDYCGRVVRCVAARFFSVPAVIVDHSRRTVAKPYRDLIPPPVDSKFDDRRIAKTLARANQVVPAARSIGPQFFSRRTVANWNCISPSCLSAPIGFSMNLFGAINPYTHWDNRAVRRPPMGVRLVQLMNGAGVFPHGSCNERLSQCRWG